MCSKAEFHVDQVETASAAAKELVQGDARTTALIDIITKSNIGVINMCGSILDNTARQDKEIAEIKHTVADLSKETWLQRNWKAACFGFAAVCVSICFFGISYLEVKYGKPAHTANTVVQHYIEKQ